MLYKVLGSKLLETIESGKTKYSFTMCGYQFGFEHKTDYSGLMAKVNFDYIQTTKDKQGYFDIIGITGPWSKITHDQLFQNLLSSTTLEECEEIWRGIKPKCFELNDHKSKEKTKILLSLLILMFEQEINFGREDWQRWSHFNPSINNPNYQRPRDLIMGFIKMMFKNNSVKVLSHFKDSDGLLLPPKKDSDEKKEFFDVLRNDSEAEALFTGEILEKFQAHIKDKDINKYIKEYRQKNLKEAPLV
jgi:hypothetical protein